MAKLILVAANEEKEYVAMSMQHVHFENGKVSVEIPYFADNGAKGVYLSLSRQEALEFAARLTNTVSNSL